MKRAKQEATVSSHVAVGRRHTFKSGKHESLQTRLGCWRYRFSLAQYEARLSNLPSTKGG